MASIKVRPYRNGGHEIDISFKYPDGKPARIRRTTRLKYKSDREREAQRILNAALDAWEAKQRGDLLDGPELTIVQAMALWTSKGAAGALPGQGERWKPSTRREREKDAERVAQMRIRNRVVGDARLRDILAVASEVVAALQKKSASTANHRIEALNGAIAVGVMLRSLPSSTTQIPLRARGDDARRTWITAADLEAMLESCGRARGTSRERERLILLLMARGGLRSGEVRALRWSDLEVLDSTAGPIPGLWVRQQLAATNDGDVAGGVPLDSLLTLPKGGRERLIPLHADVAEALADYADATGVPPGAHRFMFPRPGKGSLPMAHSTLYGLVRRVARAAGVCCMRTDPRTRRATRTKKKVNPHALRHTFETHLGQCGVPGGMQSELMGHGQRKRARTTAGYDHTAEASRLMARSHSLASIPRVGDPAWPEEEPELRTMSLSDLRGEISETAPRTATTRPARIVSITNERPRSAGSGVRGSGWAQQDLNRSDRETQITPEPALVDEEEP